MLQAHRKYDRMAVRLSSLMSRWMVGLTKHYAAVLNNKSKSGCALGDMYIVDLTDKVWVQGDTGTCSPNAYIQQGTINNGQYSSVDIVVGGSIVKRLSNRLLVCEKSVFRRK